MVKRLLFYCILGILGSIGYIVNIVRLVGSDFSQPYKSEVIRTIGVFVPPIGAVVGYIDLGK